MMDTVSLGLWEAVIVFPCEQRSPRPRYVAVSLRMTVSLWGRDFGSLGVTLDRRTVNEHEEHVL